MHASMIGRWAVVLVCAVALAGCKKDDAASGTTKAPEEGKKEADKAEPEKEGSASAAKPDEGAKEEAKAEPGKPAVEEAAKKEPMVYEHPKGVFKAKLPAGCKKTTENDALAMFTCDKRGVTLSTQPPADKPEDVVATAERLATMYGDALESKETVGDGVIMVLNNEKLKMKKVQGWIYVKDRMAYCQVAPSMNDDWSEVEDDLKAICKGFLEANGAG